MYNISMALKDRQGFTIIEVILFLAITGALLAGLLAGSVSSIKRQRYNDSVNDFVEFLRRTYSEVVNVENERTGTIGDSRSCSITGMVNDGFELSGRNDGSWTKWTKTNAVQAYDGKPGRSQCAIYGMLITFGENDENTIYTYDVIGLTIEDHAAFNANTTYKDINEALRAVNADILTLNVQNSGGNPICDITGAGNIGRYNLQWDARVEKPDGSLFKGSVLIVRSPISGTIHTMFVNQPIGASAVIDNRGNAYSVSGSNGYCSSGNLNGYAAAVSQKRLLKPFIEDTADPKFHIEEVDLCVGSNDSIEMDGQRRNVRLLADGRNATAVELVAADDKGENKCIK